MSTIADYSILTKAFLTSNDVDFSKTFYPPLHEGKSQRCLAVVPLALSPHLTTRDALHFDWSKLGSDLMWNRVSCRDADGNFIGNIVRVQPGVREGSIRLVAKVAVPAASEGDVADIKVNTFVLLRTDSATSQDLPIAVATISEGYTLHKHLISGNDPLDDVENANYVSFTINHLNGYTSVDFNPDAYVTYDVMDALSRSIDGLHIAFDTASGDLKLLDKDGNVLDQANLPIKADVIIAEGEEGYKYVKTDVKQDIHAAKAWMPEGKTAWETVEAVPYTMKHAALVVGNASTPASRVFVDQNSGNHPISTEPVQFEHVVIDNSIYMLTGKTEAGCSLRKVKGEAGEPFITDAGISEGKVTLNSQSYTIITNEQVEVDVIKGEDGVTPYVLVGPYKSNEFQAWSLDDNSVSYTGTIVTLEGTSTGGVVGITPDGTHLYTFDETAETPSKITSISGGEVRWLDTKVLTEVPNHTLKYGLEAFVWTVKGEGDVINEPFFQQLNASLLALGFHEGDDIALGTNLTTLAPTGSVSPLNKVDADEYMHGKDNKATRELEVNTQRANAKEELVAWNAQHPTLTEDRSNGTIIDSSGLDVRNGSIILGCGRVGKDNDLQKVNYGIQMKDRPLDPIRGRSESLDFTISQRTGAVGFDENGHATNLTSSTLLSIEAGSYISGAPTCLILAEVTHNSNSEGGSVVFTPVRMTAGFSVSSNYETPGGLSLTIHDYRENITSILNPGGTPENAPAIPAIIEVQALYTHLNAETVPAQQMHTYIGEWVYISANDVAMDHPECSFLCNKIEEWMTAVGLADTTTAEGVKLYVVIRVY